MTLPRLATGDRVIDAVLVITCGIAQAAALAMAAFATRDAFGALHAGQSPAPAPLMTLGAAGLVAAGCVYLARQRAEALGQSYASSLRHALYAQIARLPKSRHEDRRVGALSLRFVGDLSAARLWFGKGLPETLSAAVVLPGAVAILFALDPALASIGLLPLGLSLLVMGVVAWHLERRHRDLRQRRARIAISLIERIAIAPELDLMGRTDKELRALDRDSASLRDRAVARRGRTAGLQALLQGGLALSGLAMFWAADQMGTAPATLAASLSVMALVAAPLQDLGSAWDHACAWRVAREKALRLLGEPVLAPRGGQADAPVAVDLQGMWQGAPLAVSVQPGDIATLRGPRADLLARHVSGLDACANLQVSIATTGGAAHIAHIGDAHIGLQGSLRRSATLMSRKRPDDTRIAQILTAFGLEALLAGPKGLDQRVAENGKGLTRAHTLRLDLARAVLGKAELVVIASSRWSADPDRATLLQVLRHQTDATLVIAETPHDTPAAQPAEAP